MKNTVIFDLDGLLIDSEIVSYEIYRDLTKEYGLHFTIEEYIHDYSGRTGVVNMQTLIKKYSLPISVDSGLSFFDMKENEYIKAGIALKKGAVELLAYLKRNRYKILLASSSSKERAIDILNQNGIASFFDDMVFGPDIKRGKPYPDIFVKACERAGEPPENCLVLEDSEAGIQAAYSAGVDVICIPDMKVPDVKFRRMAAAKLESLADVVLWLEKAE